MRHIAVFHIIEDLITGWIMHHVSSSFNMTPARPETAEEDDDVESCLETDIKQLLLHTVTEASSNMVE
jgi:hypothetical protein